MHKITTLIGNIPDAHRMRVLLTARGVACAAGIETIEMPYAGPILAGAPFHGYLNMTELELTARLEMIKAQARSAVRRGSDCCVMFVELASAIIQQFAECEQLLRQAVKQVQEWRIFKEFHMIYLMPNGAVRKLVF